MITRSAYLHQNDQIIEEMPAPPFLYLVFEGGGVRGQAYCGVIEILQKSGVLSTIIHVAGSSIGSIAALFVALGYDAAEIKTLLGQITFSDYLEKNNANYIPEFVLKFSQYYSIFARDGFSMSSGERLIAWIKARIEAKLGNPKATFADLAAKVCGDTNYKYLSVVTTNLTRDKAERLNHETTPNLPIFEAIMRSSAFPGVFKAIEVDNGEIIETYVDGGLKNNLPANIFDEARFLPPGYSFTELGKNPATLLVKIDSLEEGLMPWGLNHPKPIRTLRDFLKALLTSSITRDQEIHDEYTTNVITVLDGGIATLQFDITEIEKEVLIKNGMVATLNFLQNHMAQAYTLSKPFKNEYAWISTKTLEELQIIIKRYEAMREVIPGNLGQIAQKIDWLKRYQALKFQAMQTGMPINIEPPSKHIDLYSDAPQKKINDEIKYDMQQKLAVISAELSTLSQTIGGLKNNFEYHQAILHHFSHYDQVVYLTILTEKYHSLIALKEDLETKLNINKTKQVSCPWLPLFNDYLKHLNMEYTLAADKNENFLPSILSHLSLRKASCINADGIQLNFDFFKELDSQLYLLALILVSTYLQKNSSFIHQLVALYELCFNQAFKYPQDLSALGEEIHQTGCALTVAAYKIESLINLFYYQHQSKEKYAPLNIDQMLAILHAKQKPTHRPLKKTNQEIEMAFIYRSAGLETTQDFLMFGNAQRQSQTKALVREEEKKMPKWMRRL